MRVASVIAPGLVACLCLTVSPPVSGAPLRGGSTGAAAASDEVPAPLAGWPSEQLAEGLTLYRGTLGDPSRPGRWAVTITRPGDRPDDLLTRAEATALARRLTAAGFTPEVEPITGAGYVGVPPGPLGWRVRAGVYASRATAESLTARIVRAGFAAVAESTRHDPVEIDAADGLSAAVRVAVLDPRRYRGEITASYGRALARRETTTSMARARGAILAVNAGYFVLHRKDGLQGVPAGIGVYDGKLESLASNGRAALLLGDRPRIARLSTEMTVAAEGRRREVDGVNRQPGLIRNCGGVGGDSPTEEPRHDVTCTDSSEVVLFTPALGRATPGGPGVEVVLDADDRVIRRRGRGGPVPADGRVLAGIGAGATWLTRYAKPGTRLDIRQRVRDETGAAVPLGRDDVVNGGPVLIRGGRVHVDVGSDGVYQPEDPGFLYHWGIVRAPRVMLGIDRLGRLILVVADGRRAGYSHGLSLLEGARFLRQLGAEEAINLDGGGSVTLAVRGKVANRPSNEAERTVGDAILFLPAAAEGD